MEHHDIGLEHDAESVSMGICWNSNVGRYVQWIFKTNLYDPIHIPGFYRLDLYIYNYIYR